MAGIFCQIIGGGPGKKAGIFQLDRETLRRPQVACERRDDRLPRPSVFIAALAAVYLLPGPDMALVISTSALGGPRSGHLSALGLAVSRAAHVTLSALGLAALFHAHPILFDGVRWLGAAYLLLLAWRMLRAGGRGGSESGAIPAGVGWAAVRNGVRTNLLNLKALMFCALLLPQFISAKHDLAAQYLLLEAILVGLGLAFDNVLFEKGSSRLTTKAKNELDKIALALHRYKNIEFEIQGHVCCTPQYQREAIDKETKKRQLASNRAERVYKYLAFRRIEKRRMTPKGYGNSKPLGKEPEYDRRVEIVITKI